MSSQAAASSEWVDLHIYFAGLMVFAPSSRRLNALVVDARDPKSSTIAGVQSAVPHLPAIQFDRRYAVNSEDFRISFDDAFGEKKSLWVLDRNIVRLDPAATTLETELEIDTASIQGERTPKSAASARRCEWIAPLRGVQGAKAAYKPGVLNPLQAASLSSPLAGSVWLERGTFSPVAFTEERGGFIVWNFQITGQKRTMASVLRYTARVRKDPERDSVRLIATKFDGSDGGFLELRPRPGEKGENERIEVWVLNLERDVIQLQRPPSPIRFGEPNPEYLFFHDLLTNPPIGPADPQGLTREIGRVLPALEPCRDRGMSSLFFPSSGGESSHAAPCSPAFG